MNLLILLLLLPLNASALLCENDGTCADSKLNQSYEIRREMRLQGHETRRAIRQAHRHTGTRYGNAHIEREAQRQREHLARRKLLNKREPEL